ncbi:cytochrome b/b6 domain-containing protein [Sphaerotilus sp.]|uniref:cytochrome b/b6 domain-containing protein n=1 Tax=Sphaerotilus sp. TaxID=2093942 RepID=UPI00286E313A|nr:cytochrome b/b6 domain-containing protein [Sphaerotilus sp.]
MALTRNDTSDGLHLVRVWDWPTRLFHWALVLCVAGAVVSAKVGGNAMPWHFRFGLAVLALLVFRLVWGVIGGHWSRFTSFLYAPTTLLRYVRGQAHPQDRLDVGHSPTGALSVFALLGLLAVQVATGLVADDEIASTGPLIRFVESATSLAATSWHKSWGQWLLLGLVVLHLCAIAVYRVVHRNDLVTPMLVGDKQLPPAVAAAVPASADHVGRWVLALAALSLGVAAALWVQVQGG